MTDPTPFVNQLSLEDAIEKLVDAVQPIAEFEEIATLHSLGRVLREPLVSSISVPPFANSAMDGYAVRSSDIRNIGERLKVSLRITAGSMGQRLVPGTAARIFTGAPIPMGADAVVIQEDCEPQGEDVVLNRVPVAGQHIRSQGEDIASDALILPSGALLTPAAVGLVATIGVPTVKVVRRPRVGFFTTGTELHMPGEALQPGGIYNSNRFMLYALLSQMGCHISDLGNVPDSLSATRNALRHATADHDLIVTTGGVSVGEEDHVKSAVAAEGELHAWLLNTKPGRPVAFGHIGRHAHQQCLFLGLPGNPVSALFTFCMLARVVIMSLQGRTWTPIPTHSLRSEDDWLVPDARRREFLRARRTPAGTVRLFHHQGSGVLTSMVWADGFVDNPAGRSFRAGDMVKFIPFSELAL